VLLLLSAVAAMGWFYIKREQAEAHRAVRATLEAVVDLKVDQIVRWRNERLADANIIRRPPYAARRALDVLAQPNSAATRSMFTGWLDPILAGGPYERAVLLDDQLAIRLIHPAGPTRPLAEALRPCAERALRTHAVVASDLHPEPGESHAHLSLVVPLVARIEGSRTNVPAAGLPPSTNDFTAALLILQINADEFLFPLIRSWPTPSRSAESLLVRRDGNDALYLSTLRHRDGETLGFRLPISRQEIPAVMAVTGKQGITEGIDYRGVPVLAATRAVPGVPWFIVTKVDEDDVLAPLRVEAVMTVTVILLLFVSAFLGVVLFWRQQALSGTRAALAALQRTQRALHESEYRLQTILDQASSLVYMLDLEGRFTFVNRRLAAVLGQSRETILGSDRSRFLPAATVGQHRANDLAVIESGKPLLIEETNDEPDGKHTYLSLKFPLLSDTGAVTALCGMSTDITDRKRLEQERTGMETHLREQQRLESLGTLAGGVAHEINNPINGIMNYAQLIQDRLPEGSPLVEFTGEILRETQRVAAIVRNLLTFARTERQSHSPARMADIIEGTLTLIRTVIRHDQIMLQVSVPEGLPAVNCRTQQIQQVLLNLMTNARDALNERYPGHDPNKTMSVTAGVVELETRRWVRLTVEDHGTGITPQVRGHMFEPFFTTKPRGVGTGLGLAISHGIVREHNGRLTVDSEPGSHTCIHLDLPLATGSESES
jgi:PAS domain S-box-containing protein